MAGLKKPTKAERLTNLPTGMVLDDDGAQVEAGRVYVKADGSLVLRADELAVSAFAALQQAQGG